MSTGHSTQRGKQAITNFFSIEPPRKRLNSETLSSPDPVIALLNKISETTSAQDKKFDEILERVKVLDEKFDVILERVKTVEAKVKENSEIISSLTVRVNELEQEKYAKSIDISGLQLTDFKEFEGNPKAFAEDVFGKFKIETSQDAIERAYA